MAESFFGSLKQELLYRHSWPTHGVEIRCGRCVAVISLAKAPGRGAFKRHGSEVHSDVGVLSDGGIEIPEETRLLMPTADLHPTHDLTIKAVGEYIDGFYNARRLHSFIGYMSPLEYELQTTDWRSAA